jgi:hypothetical protein
MKSKQKKRICGGCGLPKPKREFVKSDNRCRDCRRQFWRLYKKMRKEGQVRTGVGIETWGQVDSAIREMAELQHEIQKEYAALEGRIALLKKYTDEIIEPKIFHQINLRSMLKTFLEKTHTKKEVITRYFNFGILRFHRGKLELDLDAVYAGQRMGKP